MAFPAGGTACVGSVAWSGGCGTANLLASTVSWSALCGVSVTSAVSQLQGRIDWAGLCQAAATSLNPALQGRADWSGACQAVATPIPMTLSGAVSWSGQCALATTPSAAVGRVDFAGACRASVIPQLASSLTGNAGAWSGACAVQVTGVNIYGNGYAHRAEIIIPDSSIQMTAAQPYVLYLIETQTQLRSIANGGYLALPTDTAMRPVDIQFELGDRTVAGQTVTVLDHMVLPDSYDEPSGFLAVAVRIASLPPAGTSIFLYAGNASAPAQASPEAAFQDFELVIDPVTGLDLSPHNRDFRAIAGGTLPTRTIIRQLPAGNFDGTNDELELPLGPTSAWPGYGGFAGLTADVWVRSNVNYRTGAGNTANRGIACEGLRDGTGGATSFALYWRESSTSGNTALPIFGNVGTDDATNPNGYTISDANRQAADVAMYLALVWDDQNPDVAPALWKNGALLPVTAAETAPTDVAGGRVNLRGATPTIQLGYGPTRLPDFQCQRWWGRIGLFRLRAARASDNLLKTEYANQNDPRLFYGMGGWDAPTDTNHAPIAVPGVQFSARKGEDTPLDVLTAARAVDRDTGATLGITGLGTAVTLASGATIIVPTTGANAGKIVYTPAAAQNVGDTDNFNYTLSDGTKTSIGRASVTIAAGSTVPLELPVARRVIWGDTGKTAGLSSAQLLKVLAATNAAPWNDAGITIQTRGNTATTKVLLAGDYVLLEPGTNYDNQLDTTGATDEFKFKNDDYTINAPGVVIAPRGVAFDGTPGVFNAMPGNPGSGFIAAVANNQTNQAGPNRAANKINSNARWNLRGTDNVLFGICFTGRNSGVWLSGLRNRVHRCEFTGWMGVACAPSKFDAADPSQDGLVTYCSFHDPWPYGKGSSTYTKTQAGLYKWPTADPVTPGDPNSLDRSPYSTAATHWEAKTPLRMGFRHRNQNPEKSMVGAQVHRCMFRNFPRKPFPPIYDSGQSDAIETCGDVSTVNQTTLTRTDNANGTVKTIDTWFDMKTGIYDTIIKDHLEFQPWPEDEANPYSPPGSTKVMASAAGGALFDIKGPGTIIKRVKFLGNIAAKAHFDLRGSPFHVIEDVDIGVSGMDVNGYGSTAVRFKCGALQFQTGDENGGTALNNKKYQCAEGCRFDHITCDDIRIGVDNGAANGTAFKCNDIKVTNASSAGSITAANTWTATCSIARVPGNGAPDLPRDLPDENSVGVNAPWVGLKT